MLANFMAAVRETVVSWARACGHAVKRLVEQARSAATAAAGVARDSVRSRTELLANHALVGQQLIVLRRSVKRPALGRADRLAMVVFARLSSAWRDALSSWISE